MNIAIVGPSPVPFSMGGMEYLQQGLYKYINELSNNNCELIKLPSKENSFWDIIKTYKSFYELDLRHFDMVISIKYPAWMVQHSNHICYMAHRLRGFYDTYHFLNMPDDFYSELPYLKELIDYINNNKEPRSLGYFFDLVDNLERNSKHIPNDLFSFPNPLIRKIIRYMDDYALSKNRIKKYMAISNTVRTRKDYFPKNCDVQVIYPPSFLDGFKSNEYSYLFTISRLDGPKRINLMIEAMKYVKGDIKLLIAGKGPEEENLKNLAANDKRIEFLGFVNDKEVIELYSNALAVLFMPYDEDYGLVTIEAMKCSKPVITCHDSGGTTEFVTDGVTGFVADAEPKKIGKKIQMIVDDKNLAIKMGKEAINKVKDITWNKTISLLLSDNNIIQKTNNYNMQVKAKKIVVTSHFSIYPPLGGGQSRVYNLYKNVAKKFYIEILSFGGNNEKNTQRDIANNMKEIVVPKTVIQAEKEWHFEKEIGIPVSDSALPLVSHLTPKYEESLKGATNDADVIIMCHPFLLNEVKKCNKEKIIIYEAQDIEYEIKKKSYIRKNKTTDDFLKLIYNIEKEACEMSHLIMTCSEEDKNSLSKLYNIPLNKFIVIPNGVDCSEIEFVSHNDRNNYKKELNIEEDRVCIFIGSWHPPNIEACKYIIEIARKIPDHKFIIVGSVCMAIKDEVLPKNVGLMGIVSDEEKRWLYKTADVALNPMTSGSGTNLKMFDYMAAGIPIITTEFGTRGIQNKSNFIVSEVPDMHHAIINLKNNISKLDLMKSRNYVQSTFDWEVISKVFTKEVEKLT